MKLKKVHITEFQCLRDSNEFEVDDITCLVGKNESGKTALLQAIYRLNPIIKNEGKYDITDDYPRWDVEDYRIAIEKKKNKHAIVARATFEIENDDVKAFSDIFGRRALKDNFLEISKGYDNTLYFDCEIDEKSAINHLLAQSKAKADLKSKIESCDKVDDIIEVLRNAEQTEPVQNLSSFFEKVNQYNGTSEYVFNEILLPRIPKFLYFDEYYQMKGRANIEALKDRIAQKNLKPSDHPLLGLINLARLDLDQLINPSRTRELKNRLEGAGNQLTKRIIPYWSQNRYLQLQFDVRHAQPEDPDGMQKGTNIWGDVYNRKHNVTTEIGMRSRGFIWFFSFLAWYSDIKNRNERVILLLDEPGLSLHAKAQEDLLRYFEAEIKGNHQLIYTTHSPFMVDPTKFKRVRIVQDLSIDTDEKLPPDKEGTKVFTDVLEATGDSLFPLQGALGYEIYQTLFIGPNNLVVEGVSDLLYLQIMSAYIQEKGKIGLNPQWTITPVGGSDKVPAFVALIGSQRKLNVVLLIDYHKKDKQTIENLYKKRLLEKKKVITFADFVSADEADIEDLFENDFYLKLVNAEFASFLSNPITKSDLNNNIPRILMRLEKFFKSNPLSGNFVFNHYRPARYLTENLASLKNDISQATLERFEKVFKLLNSLL